MSAQSTDIKEKELKNISQEEREFANGKIPKLYIKFAIPGVVGVLFTGLQTVVDGIILGNFAGTNALASVNIVIPAYTLITAISIMICIGSQTLVAMNLGKGDYKNANNALLTGFLTTLFFSVLISIILLVFRRQTIALMGANEELMHDSIRYLIGLAPFFPILTMMFFGDYSLKVIGRPVFATLIMSGTLITNILLDLLFIAVFGMGTFGAGLATGLAFTLGALISVPQFLGTKNIVSLKLGRFRPKMVGRMLYNGSSEGISELSAGISIFLFNRVMMSLFRADGVAAFSVINIMLYVGIIIFVGISDGIIPVVSYNFGSKRWDRIKEFIGFSARVNTFIGVTLFMIMFLLGQTIITVFFPDGSEAATEIAVGGTKIIAFAFLLNGLNILASSYFTAIGNAKISVIISMMRGLLFILLGLTVLPELFGINGVWYVIPAAELLTFIFSITLVLSSIKKNTRKVRQ